MAEKHSWQEIVASSLNWKQAHHNLDQALDGLKPEERGRLADGHPHSVWDLVEHIRIAQDDLMDFLTNPGYTHDLAWPADYWPRSHSPTDDEWKASLAAIARDREKVERFITSGRVDLAAVIPNSDGKTYLRTALVIMDHTSYHVGQIVDVRRLTGSWRE